jgi:hypothetical protein
LDMSHLTLQPLVISDAECSFQLGSQCDVHIAGELHCLMFQVT